MEIRSFAALTLPTQSTNKSSGKRKLARLIRTTSMLRWNFLALKYPSNCDYRTRVSKTGSESV
jgi:hypothetical protein